MDKKRLLMLLKNVMLKIGLIKDYIVDEGKSGEWYYRKYKSGIAECWMCWQGTVFPYTTNMISSVARNGFVKSWNLPFTFKEPYTKTASVTVSSGIGIVCSGGLNDSLSAVCLHWASNTDGQSTVNISIRGLWKSFKSVSDECNT